MNKNIIKLLVLSGIIGGHFGQIQTMVPQSRLVIKNKSGWTVSINGESLILTDGDFHIFRI